MTPPPFYRRITTWLGLLILIFITWAWHHSYWHGSSIGWGSDKRYLSATSIYGVTQFRYVQVRPGTIPSIRLGSKGFTVLHQDSSLWSPSRPSQLPLHHQRESGSGDPYVTPPLPPWIDRNLTIPWWLITLLFLLTWISLHLWHRRRTRLRYLTASPPPPFAPPP